MLRIGIVCLLAATPVASWSWNNLLAAVALRPRTVTFHKEPDVDPTEARNQDCITSDVCLTRGPGGPMFNAQYYKHRYGTGAPMWLHKSGFYERDSKGLPTHQNTQGMYWGICEIEGSGWDSDDDPQRTSNSDTTNATIAALRLTDGVKAKIGSPDNFYDMYSMLALIELAAQQGSSCGTTGGPCANDPNPAYFVVNKSSDAWADDPRGFYWAPRTYNIFQETVDTFFRADGSILSGVSAYHIVNRTLCYMIPKDVHQHPQNSPGGYYGTIKFSMWQDGSDDGGEIKYVRSVPQYYHHNRVQYTSWLMWLFGGFWG